MAHHDDMDVQNVSPQMGQTNTTPTIPIEVYFHQIQQCLNTTLTELSELRKSHGALESRVSDMHTISTAKDDLQCLLYGNDLHFCDRLHSFRRCPTQVI